MTQEEGPAVGSVAEEAVKLLEAVKEWATHTGHDQAAASPAGDRTGRDLLRDVHEHLAVGAGDCLYCPVCRVIAAVRNTSPEVRHHLGAAAGSMLQAMSGLLAPADPGSPPRQEPSVEHIDLDDDEEG